MDLHQLTQELPYQWKIQALRNGTATCVAYIDARDAMRLLDKVAGPENWQDKYYEACGQLFCTVSIKTDSGWVEKSDSGIVTADTAKVDLEMTQKGSASDAFKRACVKWGIGRFLYDLDAKRLPEAVFEANKWNLTDYINGLKGKAPTHVAAAATKSTAPATAPSTFKQPQELDWMNDGQLADLLKLISEGKYDGKNGQEVVKLARLKYKVNRAMAEDIDEAMASRVGNDLPKKDLTKEAGSIFNDPKVNKIMDSQFRTQDDTF
jgi:hypothetical protein